MTDIWPQKKRSAVMALIKSTHNLTTEERLVSLLRQNQIIGWRRHLPLLGKPDFAYQLIAKATYLRLRLRYQLIATATYLAKPRFSKQKGAVFVDGCFWHGCPNCYTRPKTNRAFWDRKREDNMARDKRVNRQLRHQGWKVIRIWQHSLQKSPSACLNRIRRALLATV